MEYKFVLDHTGKPYARYFEEISAIPRGSFKEQAIADYIVDFAKERGLIYRRDEMNNVLIRKAASPGYENHEVVLLQGHMDMIQTKIPGSTFNFDDEPLQLIVKDGYLMAKETTCGSDDGVAIAYMLAILDDPELQHPALECVFTVAEEAGLAGALYFDCSDLKARKYINMDGNLEGTNLVIASGAITGEFIKEYESQITEKAYQMNISIGGFLGGHGSNFSKEVANALKVSGRILYSLSLETPFRIVSLNGGNMTTIANWAEITIALDQDKVKRAEEIAKTVMEQVKEEYKECEKNLSITVTGHMKENILSMDEAATKSITKLLFILPFGVEIKSMTYPGIPLTSANLEVCTTKNNAFSLMYRPRSAYASRLDMWELQCELYANICGVRFVSHGKYYGHNIETGGPLHQVYNQVWKELTGNEIVGVAAHFGNEIGTFMSKHPGMDMILLVATHYDAHTPRERLDLASFDRCYECLKRILERI